MSQGDAIRAAQQFLGRMASGAEPAEIAQLFSADLEMEIPGDAGALPWIGRRTGRSAIAAFVQDSRTLIERLRFRVDAILAGDDRAVILGSLASKAKQTGRIIETSFAIVLTVANGEIVRFRILEDSFAVSKAARRS